ncbi:RluA family pseudouridine synthase [Saprospira grandis]|uniref:Ribosomal large subunit pseudouridine synthase d n=1 Tax=Saprospira grandis (strain Lewin) TaxID=984262 RepID=H6LAE5_SAPGL|nr:RNA pseudouridine synthase [Saprospira grandis]AFC24430.1 ribosomal large subunit pseudouridine synthase d [Saprospira grandis str. Lewin]
MREENYTVIHEDNHLIALNKPAGWLVQGDQTGDRPLSEFAKDYIKFRYQKPGAVFLGVIHRIDRPVSGTVLFARTSKGLERMNKLFKERAVQKRYLAIVEKRPEELSGTLLHFIAKDKERNIVSVSNTARNKHYKFAKLDYRLLGGIGEHHLLEVIPHTGRPHQIRAQLARMGCPIRGDVKYGAKNKNKDGRIHLHAASLSFIHPVKKEAIDIWAPIPNEQIWKLFQDALGEMPDYKNVII